MARCRAKYSFLEPAKTTDIHLNAVKEYDGASSDPEVRREYGVLINTAMGLAPYLEGSGLGGTWKRSPYWCDPG